MKGKGFSKKVEVGKILLLCEKYLVAYQITKALESKFGKAKKKGMFFEVGPYVVAYAQGHLVDIADDVINKEWRFEELPIFPEKFRYSPRKGTEKLLKELVSVIKQSEVVFNFGDVEREGELIIRLILQYAGWKDWSCVYRFWSSKALTKEVILSTLENGMRPSREFDSLYYAALARQHADFIVGVNMTRLITLIQRKKGLAHAEGVTHVWSVGRVQSPTLRLVVERDLAIENFVPVPYFLLKCDFSYDDLKWTGTFVRGSYFKASAKDMFSKKFGHFDLKNLPEDALLKDELEEVVKKIENRKTGMVDYVSMKEVVDPSPKLFSLASLQAEANRLFKFTPSKTLKIAQKLYEEYRILSYPRTDSEYLPSNLVHEVRDLLQTLTPKEFRDLIDWNKVSSNYKRVFDDSKVSDHHAIVPQGAPPKNIDSDSMKIYNLVLKRFVAAFSKDSKKISVEINTKVSGLVFKACQNFRVEAGWRKVYGVKEDKKDLHKFEGLRLETQKRGQVLVYKERHFVEEDKTSSPPRFTEGTLVKEMKAKGLGTAATRDSVIERLKEVGYLRLENGKLISTEKGRKLILELINDSSLSSVEITSIWEKELNEIYEKDKGEEGYNTFIKNIKDFIRKEVERLKQKLIYQEKKKGCKVC